MSESPNIARAQITNLWVQTAAILLAGGWALYMFVYKEIQQPSDVPAHVTLKVALTPQEFPIRAVVAQAEALVPLHLNIAVSNPTTREVFLLPSTFIVFGQQITPNVTNFDELLSSVTFKEYTHGFPQRHVLESRKQVVALGPALGDSSLKPGETVHRQLVVFVPATAYRVLTAGVTVPTVVRESNLTVHWRFDPKSIESIADMFYKEGKTLVDVPTTTAGEYAVDDDLQLQMSRAESQLALVQMPSSAPAQLTNSSRLTSR